MSPDNVAALLKYFYDAYPPRTTPGEDVPLVWLQHLNEMDVGVAREAAHRWVATEKWMPSISDFNETCRNVQRDAQRTIHAAIPAPLSTDDEATARDVQRAFIKATRQSLEMAKNGASAKEIEEAFMAAAPKKWVSRPDTYPCKCAAAKGWVFTDTNIVHPCKDCRPEMYARWAEMRGVSA